MRAQPCLDLAQLDAEATDLDLMIVTSDKLDRPVGTPTPQIASAVHPRRWIGAEWIDEETLGSQIVAVQIPTSHTVTSDIQLAHHPDRHRRTVCIKDVDARIGQGLADGDNRIVFGIFRQMFCSTGNGGLCRTISIDNLDAVRP